MIKKIAIGLGVVVVLLLVVIATRPSTFEVKRSLQMGAPPEIVYAHVIDFREWARWSPWDQMDPKMTKTYSGAETGVGSKYAWAGDRDTVGSGSMTIETAKPSEAIGIKLEFTVPFATTNQTDFAFTPAAGGTNVTWSMKGTNDFMGKAFSLVMDMDKMVGADFEKGLATLKTHAEAAAKKAADEKAAAEKAAADAAAAAAAAPAADAGTP
ncbi:MAG: SRPBCC family protein [Myxococcus sp.]|nr:SRPBCC family protein [Myxococcus sp.]